MKKHSAITVELGIDGVPMHVLFKQARSIKVAAKNEISQDEKVVLEHERDAAINQIEALLKELEAINEGQKQWAVAANDFLALYWGGENGRVMDMGEMRKWLENQPLDCWFFIHLIELAGKKALDLGYSERASTAAKSKNIEPRAWVLVEWAGRTDKKQSKSAFALRYAERVKSKFGLTVTPNTIERSWLPKG